VRLFDYRQRAPADHIDRFNEPARNVKVVTWLSRSRMMRSRKRSSSMKNAPMWPHLVRWPYIAVPPEPSHNSFGCLAFPLSSTRDLMDGTCTTLDTGLPSLRSHAFRFGP